MEEEKDDEISIDFGKIKDFFKKKEKAEEKKPEVHAEIKQEPKESAETPQEKKEDEEFSLDFSRIKNIFRKKERVTESKAEAKDDEEITIDFSKLKNIKNIFKKSDKVSESGEGVSDDYKKIKDFLVTHRILLLLIIPILLSVFLRVQPAYLPITDDWASDTVINNLRSQIKSQINQQYPNLPDDNKDALVENELQKVLKEQKSEINQQITATSNFFKSRLQDDAGNTYLLAIDPYFWMRNAKNVIENGHPGDEIRNGQQWDNHMFAPEGRGVPPDMFHAYFEAYLFKFLSFFNRNLNLMAVVFYVPVLISALAVIPAFFITRKLTGNFGGFVAATIVAIHPSFLSRTAGGFADTDAYNVMFPLFIAWIFLEALEAKSTRNTIIFSVVGGLLVSFYSFTWGGWWYIFDFILISTVLYIAYYTFVHRKELTGNFVNFAKQKTIKNSITFLAVFFIVSALSVSFFVNFGHFTAFATNPMGFARLKEVGITTIWPNVFTTVAEQNPASLNNVINQVGLGKFHFFLIALIGITLALTTKERKKLWFVIGAIVWYLIIFLLKIQDLNVFLALISIPIIIRIIVALWESDRGIEIKYAIFLILWFIATIYASTKGVRFTLLLVPAFAIGFGIALGELYRYASVWITKGLHVNKYISKITVIALLVIVLLIPPFISANRAAENEIPSFNDAWRISLEKIKEDSQANAIINSWWDFGHWFKFWADRAVTFDGTSQNTPQAHWIGKVLLTDDENLAVGILRMLDCSGGTMSGGTKAFGSINAKINDGAKTVSILNDIIVKDKEGAREYLKGMFNEEEAEEILSYTHCEPPEDYFITSDDMVGKSGVWAHFGSWDFDRGLIYNTLKKKEYSNDLDKSIEFLQGRFDYSEEEAENIFYEVQSITTSDQANDWIAPWPGYAGTVGCSKNEDILTCGNGFTINLTSKEVFVQSQQGILHPKSISFPTDDGIIVKEYNESLVTLQNGRDLGFALIKESDNYRLLQMDSDLTASMFTRMFYQEGIGLRYFKKFSDEKSVFGGRIIIWKVDWEGKEKNIVETIQ
jgi:asparagine N-glycosylation enzyme membrane subunit Stt3